MSVQTEIDRIAQNVASAYAALKALGAAMPTEQTSENLAATAGTAKAVLYSAQELDAAQQLQARENIGINADFKAEIVAMVIESLGGNPIFGYVDENNNIIVSGNLADGTYSVKYEMEDGSTVDIGDLVLDTNTYYSVTNTLTNCTNGNSATQAVEGGSYSATISAKDGYELSSVKVTMGGTDISSTAVSGGTITIANVTGNIVITAVAEETVVTPTYTNFADPTSADWKTGYRLSGGIDGTTELTGGVVTNYVSVQQGDTLEVTGINIADSNSRQAFWFNSSNNSILKATALTSSASLSGVSYDANSLICTVTASCDSDAKMRFSGLVTGTSEDVVIKIKRNGTYL